LDAAFPGQLQIDGAPGRGGSFEITVGNDADSAKQIYSKLHSGSFPDAEGVIKAVEQFLKDGTVLPIDAAQGGCTVQ